MRSHENPSLTRRTILIIDDDEFARELLELFFVKAGFQVLQAVTGEAALGLFRTLNSECNLAIIDYNMPGIDGIQTFKALHELRPDLRAVLYTGNIDIPELSRQCPEGLDCRAKDFSTRGLGALLGHLVQER
jgi:DNA-binding NtrC family response regulator